MALRQAGGASPPLHRAPADRHTARAAGRGPRRYAHVRLRMSDGYATTWGPLRTTVNAIVRPPPQHHADAGLNATASGPAAGPERRPPVTFEGFTAVRQSPISAGQRFGTSVGVRSDSPPFERVAVFVAATLPALVRVTPMPSRVLRARRTGRRSSHGRLSGPESSPSPLVCTATSLAR